MQVYTLFAILPLIGTYASAAAIGARNIPEATTDTSATVTGSNYQSSSQSSVAASYTSAFVPSSASSTYGYTSSAKSCKRPTGTTSQAAQATSAASSSEYYYSNPTYGVSSEAAGAASSSASAVYSSAAVSSTYGSSASADCGCHEIPKEQSAPVSTSVAEAEE